MHLAAQALLGPAVWQNFRGANVGYDAPGSDKIADLREVVLECKYRRCQNHQIGISDRRRQAISNFCRDGEISRLLARSATVAVTNDRHMR